jgi:flagellar biosynthesis/type III secretory pathway M-ring protein FliF/YscJ
MGSFWKIILLAALIFYIFTLIIKWIFRRKMRKLAEQMEQFGQNGTTAENEEPKPPRINPNIGEYTDFEEIEEKP